MKPQSLHVVQSLDPANGGTSVSVPALAHAILEDGRYDNDVVHFGGAPSAPAGGRRANPLALLLPTRARRDLERTVSRSDVVHVHGIWTSHAVATVRLARRHRKPLVVSAHGMLDEWALGQKRWKKVPYAAIVERRNLRAADCLRALTSVEADSYRAFGLRNPIAIVPNGVSIPEHVDANAFLDRYPHLRGQRLLLFVGRLHPKKGVDLLVDAWRQICARFPDVHLVLAGPDEGGLKLAGLERDRIDPGARITVTGLLCAEQKWALLASGSVFALPSFSEGLSMAVLEALAAGLPVVMTRGCNFREAEHLESTFMTEPAVRTLRESLESVLLRPAGELRSRGAAGARFVRSHYSWRSVGDRMADTYDWLRRGRAPFDVPPFVLASEPA